MLALAVGLIQPGRLVGLLRVRPGGRPYSMQNITAGDGVQAWWSAGVTGQGVDVALIDTGVAPVPALSGNGKIVNGPDLSLESQNPNLQYLDTNGHGTFMAGIIGGNDGRPGGYRGVAPDSRILSVKVGDADGGVDVSQVIAAIDWVVQHRTDHGMNIRVLNLSYGTDSSQPFVIDPLAYAVERAWKAGIVVVAAAGNTGEGSGLADPAYDPWLIAVGAADTMGTPSIVGRPARVVLRRRLGLRLPQLPRSGPPRAGRPHAGPARPGLLRRPEQPERRARRPVLPRQRHVRGGGVRDRRRRAAAPGVSAVVAGSGEAAC